MRETALANIVFLRRMIPFHLCIQTWHSGVSLAPGPVCGLLEWAYISGRAGRWRSLFSYSRLCSCTVSGWQEAACAALAVRRAWARPHAIFHKVFSEIFLVGPLQLCYFYAGPGTGRRPFQERPMQFLSLSSTDPALNLALEE